VIELRSPTDSLKELKDKMTEYVENGVRLGWLVDPSKKQVYIYRPNTEVQILENPSTLSGEDVLTGFTLDLTEIWSTKIV
jgi:Uma2 family endonuclease